eukprot:349855-Chlamydomonas_euryale.AAC.1
MSDATSRQRMRFALRDAFRHCGRGFDGDGCARVRVCVCVRPAHRRWSHTDGGCAAMPAHRRPRPEPASGRDWRLAASPPPPPPRLPSRLAIYTYPFSTCATSRMPLGCRPGRRARYADRSVARRDQGGGGAWDAPQGKGGTKAITCSLLARQCHTQALRTLPASHKLSVILVRRCRSRPART